jgi:DNA polymerase-3 subunit delta'
MITNAFDKIEGNGIIAAVLRRNAESGKPNHAYLISGQAGSGKESMARAFVRTLLCAEKNGGDECRCISCRTLESANHPDVFYVKPSKNKASIGIDDIREQVIAPSDIKPYKADFKVFVINDASTMTVAAQNALLKSLEEPPSYGVFLLLTANPEMLLPTVLSRCMELRLNPVPVEKRLLQDGYKALRGEILTLILEAENAADAGDIAALMNVAAKMGEYRNDIDKVLELMYLFYRDAAAYNETGDESAVCQRDIIDAIRNTAAGNGTIRLINKAEAVSLAKYRLSRNANFSLAMDVLMFDVLDGTKG